MKPFVYQCLIINLKLHRETFFINILNEVWLLIVENLISANLITSHSSFWAVDVFNLATKRGYEFLLHCELILFYFLWLIISHCCGKIAQESFDKRNLIKENTR